MNSHVLSLVNRFRPWLSLLLLLAAVAGGHPCTAAGEKPPAGDAPLVVVMDDNYPPYVFRDAEDKVRGILPDQWLLWEQKTGRRVDLRAMDWSEAQRTIQEGRADVIDTIFFTEERSRQLDFLRPYASIQVPVYAHKHLGGIGDVASLKGFTVGVKAGDAVISHLAQRGIDTLKIYPSYEAIILAAKRDELKVFSIDQPAAVHFLLKHGLAHDFRELFVLYTGQLHRAVPRNRPERMRLVQEGFDAISPREYRVIDRKWMGSPFLLGTILRHWGPWLSVAAAVLLVLAANNVILTRRVHARTAELRQALDDVRHSLAAQRKSEQALRENHELFLLFMRHSPVYTYIKQVAPTESRTLMASDNFLQMVGRPAQEMIGKTMEELFPPDFAAKINADDWSVISKGEVLKLDEELNGRFYTTIKFPIEQEGRRLLAGYTIDITDRKRAEDERAVMQAQLTNAQKLESVGRMASGIAHDFNNMLQVILGNTELALQRTRPGERLHEIVEDIDKAARHARELTGQLQTLASQQPVKLRRLDINATIGKMIRLMHRLIGEHIRLVWRPAAGLGTVMMDPGQIEQIVANLCINARDSIQTAGHIVIETRNVRFRDADAARPADVASGDWVALTVRDNGIGIAADIRDRIFEPFFTTKAPGKGAGLGLAIVYGIVRQNGGAIHLASEPGQGTAFEIYLPRCDGDPDPARPDPASGAPRGAAHGPNLPLDDETGIPLRT